jgi:L-lactate utilization protein LutB
MTASPSGLVPTFQYVDDLLVCIRCTYIHVVCFIYLYINGASSHWNVCEGETHLMYTDNSSTYVGANPEELAVIGMFVKEEHT